ncbi:hypothetical protein AC1031_008031 [Aphanomyces cochlioides]|nr:hypothetical protein AC1031_008031 [Aphanomyces cochlioides]
MTTASRPAWYVLLDERGLPYKKTRRTSVIVPVPCTTENFTIAVKEKNSNALLQVDINQLCVYTDRASRDSELLDDDADISPFGLSKEDPLVVIVPDLDEPPPKRRHPEIPLDVPPKHSLEQLKASCTRTGDLPREGDFLRLFDWTTEDCGKTVDISMIHEITNFTGSMFYVRKEILCVLLSFKATHQEEYETGEIGNGQFILMGSPGVGKSCILALISFFIAVVKQRPVLLHRHVQGRRSNITLFLHEGKYYKWEDNGPTPFLLRIQRSRGCR